MMRFTNRRHIVGLHGPLMASDLPMRVAAPQQRYNARRLRFGLLLLVTLPLLAWTPVCRRSTEASKHKLLFRLIDEEPKETFVNRGLHEEVPVIAWHFASSDGMAGWEAVNGDRRSGLVAEGLTVYHRSGDRAPRPHLLRVVDLEAEAIEAIRVELTRQSEESPTHGKVKLLWSGANEVFSEERSLSLDARAPDDSQVELYLFRVGTHPLWRGKITMLRLDPTSVPNEAVIVRAIKAVRYAPAGDTYDAALRDSWKVKVGDELRSAFLAPPGRRIERHFRMPPDSILRFSFGMGSLIPVPITFKVFLVSREGRELLFSDTIRPGSPKARRGWLDASVDLIKFDGQQVTLVFETSSPSDYDTRLGFPAWANPEVWQRTSEPGPPNIILISLDTLRADRMSLYGYERETTPNIGQLARKAGVVFENVVAPSPWTIPSHVSLFTGLDALRHGVNHADSALSSYTYMAELFRNAGYATSAVTGGGYLRPAFGFHRGFDSFRYWGKGIHRDGEIEDGVDRLIRLLQVNANLRFFLFFHTYEIHLPFRVRQPFFNSFSESNQDLDTAFATKEIAPMEENGFQTARRYVKHDQASSHSSLLEASDYQTLGSLYDSGIAYTDFHLGRLFQALENLDLWRRTIVVVTSDHGEALGERGLAEHHYLYDFNLMIPLAVFLPEGRAVRITDQVSLVDVLPTLLKLSAIKPPSDLDGSSLIPLIHGESTERAREAWSYAASTNYGISLRIDNEFKYTYNNTAWSASHGQEESYHVGQNQKEEKNDSFAEPVAKRLREYVQQNLRTHASGLSIRFTNAGEKSFDGQLHAAFLRWEKIKSPHIPCACVKWSGPDGFEFKVPPKKSYVLILEGIRPGSMTLNAAMEPAGPAFQAQFDPANLNIPRHWILADGTWTEVDGESPPSMIGIAVEAVGNYIVPGAQPAIDTNLREQLRALGYVK